MCIRDSYCIEGRSYELKEHDIVLVNAGEVHKPILNDDSIYERIIIYAVSYTHLDVYKRQFLFSASVKDITALIRQVSFLPLQLCAG